MLIGGAFTLIVAPLTYNITRQALPHYSVLSVAVTIALGVVDIVCALALFRWMKWGFYGVIFVDIAAFINNLASGISIFQAFLGLIGLAILYWVLNMGEDKAWSHLN